MNSIVSLRTSANSSGVPIVLLVDMQQKAATARDCRDRPCTGQLPKVGSLARKIGLPVAFIRVPSESAFFNRAAPFVHWIDGFEPSRRFEDIRTLWRGV